MDTINNNGLIEYGIKSGVVTDIKEYEHSIPIGMDDAIRLSAMFSAAPALISNSIISQGVNSKTLYNITFNGQNVSPDMLMTKNNGSHISNLKSNGSGFGKQTDINAVDSSMINAATIASSVFAVASVVTSQYYLKSIDDKLSEIQKTTRDIMTFLEEDKQSKIESDFEILKDIIGHMGAIKADAALKAIKSEQISSIQRDAKSNIKFYKKLLDKALQEYISNKKGGKQDNKIIGWVRKDYFYYRLSLQVYSLAKLAEIMLMSSYNSDYLSDIYDELHNYSMNLKDDINHILSVIYDYSSDKFDNKVKIGFANTVKTVGKAFDKTPLRRTDLGKKLGKVSRETRNDVKDETKRRADIIVTREDYGVLEPYSEMIDELLKMINGNISIVGNENEMCILF